MKKENFVIKTERLVLRPWNENDFEPFAKLTADPRVMQYFPSVLSKEESDRLVMLIRSKMENREWGFWAVSLIGQQECIGFIGLNDLDPISFPTHFSPAVEIGWRLAYQYWGKGYATEGAKACLKYGFEELQLNEIVAFTAIQNMRSRAVMEKIGMHRDPSDDFEHPGLPDGHALKKHVLYRLTQEEWSN